MLVPGWLDFFDVSWLPVDPAGTFRTSYDLDLGSQEVSLLLNSIHQKVSQKATLDSRRGGYTRAQIAGALYMVVGYLLR